MSRRTVTRTGRTRSGRPVLGRPERIGTRRRAGARTGRTRIRRPVGRTRDVVETWTLPVAGVAVFLVGWHLATVILEIEKFVLPSPVHVGEVLWQRGTFLLEMTWVTFVESAGGFGLAIAVGVPLAVALASSRIVSRTLDPLLAAFNAVPKLAFAPIFVIWMGFGGAPKIVMGLVVCFFPIVLSTTAGLRSTPAELVELADSLNAGWARTMWKIRFPYALPQVFVGLKTAVALAVIGAVIGEFVGADEGLGYLVVQSQGSANIALMFAAITLLGVLGIVMFYAVAVAERLLVPWAKEQR